MAQLTIINKFIYYNINRDKNEPIIPFRQIPNSLADFWAEKWNKMSESDKENFKNKAKNLEL